MTPSCVLRAARLAAACRPFFRKKSMASSITPLEAVRASLQSIIPAPVCSRSSLIITGVICMGRFLPPALLGGTTLCGLWLGLRYRCRQLASVGVRRVMHTHIGVSATVQRYGFLYGFRYHTTVGKSRLSFVHPFDNRISEPRGHQANGA